MENAKRNIISDLIKYSSDLNKEGIRFNINKCKISLPQVKYIDHIFNQEGISPDPDKVAAVSIT